MRPCALDESSVSIARVKTQLAYFSLCVLIVGLEPAEPEQEKSPPPPEADPTFFNKVDEDVHRMIRGEKMQEEYRKVRKYKLFHFHFQ